MQLYHLAALLPVLTTFTSAIHLTSERLNQVYDVMEQISTASWENGTKAQAVLEHQYPSLSVFSPSSPFQYSQPIPSGDISQIIDIAQTTMNNRPATNDTRSIGGSQVQLGRLLSDGSSADPASLGIAILLANASQSDQQIKGVTYGSAAEQELNYQLYGVPRAQNGAISHRANQPQLWADFIFMVPPFLAYYGVQHNNRSLVEEAHHQVSLYRDVLRQDNGLWQHIRGGNGEIAEDTGLWATGNAWAAQGMLRVWATIDHSPWSNEMTQEKTDLQNWTEEILNGLKQYVTSNGMLRNYVERSDSFEESSGSALVSAAAFRLSTLNITNAHVGMGIQLLSAVSSRVNSTGYVGDVVNPFDFSSQGAESSEAQSFVIMAYAAYDEWTALGRPGNTGGDNPLGGDSAAPRNFGVGALLGAVGLVGSLFWTLA